MKGNSSTRSKEERPDAAGLKIAIVASRFNAEISERLVVGALEGLAYCGGKAKDSVVLRVPGAFEIPLAVQRVAESKRFDGIVAVGSVIRGETPHFDHISRCAADGVSRVALERRIPIGFGILTVDTPEQAMARSGPGESNKGFEAALAVVEMANLLKRF